MRQNINTSRKTYKIRSDICSEEKVKQGRGWWWYQALFEVGRNQNEPEQARWGLRKKTPFWRRRVKGYNS